MFFDSHCHLDRIDLAEFNNDIDHLLKLTREQQVSEMVCISVNMESFDEMYQKIVHKDGVYSTVGVHPDYEEARETSVEELVTLSTKDKIVAIGETGLDYFHTDGPQWQRKRFRTHIDAAVESGKPLIIHTRLAKKDTINILKDHHADKAGGVMHCFTEDWEMAKQSIDLGFYISISGIVTFKQAENVREMAAKIPDDRLLIETDSPWLAPVPFRGKTNFPGHVRLVAEKLAEIRGTDIETIAELTTQNARDLFKL
ncbi:MAG: TatD family hydrolase [Gammaproteobacteria bacterium]|jgi:TatD DNase family protein|nr:TatD family hydrolase [Gammaproteobacteria bacterium]MBT3723147.1 TatD family hydrolase [Gammaproteobacteria bacterium]MBT4076791.1 TatD family hydrolase [Gammaproteobacteria bacterium]MBT4196171.1 TatD family hydrolase [Gammaproteobacteria bacterium]MBT4448298.1 TatD family hydrolase [Gammaproteobacteria bacterium]